MGISVEKIYEEIRKEGINYGLPMTFLKLGFGNEYSKVDDLIKDIILTTRCKWVCVIGSDTIQTGMGSFVSGLSSMGMFSEIECEGRYKDPGWVHKVDRWVTDYDPTGLFNYFALRRQDMIRFDVNHPDGFEEYAVPGLKQVELSVAVKYIRVPPELESDAFEVARKHERVRVYTIG